MLTPGQKEALVTDVRADLDRAAGVLFLDYTGLTVDEANRFRRKLQDLDLSYRVMKNTLMRRALADAPYADVASCLKGTPTGVLFGFTDPVSGPKATLEFKKDCKHLKIKGGIFESRSITPQEAEVLAKLPSRNELQAEVVALALSPGRDILNKIKHPASRIVGAIEALVTKLDS